MKNTFKFMALAIAAFACFFASCAKEEVEKKVYIHDTVYVPTEPVDTDTAFSFVATFGGQEIPYSYFKARTNDSIYLIQIAKEMDGQYLRFPYLKIGLDEKLGIGNLELYIDRKTLYDPDDPNSAMLPQWACADVNWNFPYQMDITKFDATSRTLSASFICVMYDFYDYWTNANDKPDQTILNVKMKNIKFELSE